MFTTMTNVRQKFAFYKTCMPVGYFPTSLPKVILLILHSALNSYSPNLIGLYDALIDHIRILSVGLELACNGS